MSECVRAAAEGGERRGEPKLRMQPCNPLCFLSAFVGRSRGIARRDYDAGLMPFVSVRAVWLTAAAWALFLSFLTSYFLNELFSISRRRRQRRSPAAALPSTLRVATANVDR